MCRFLIISVCILVAETGSAISELRGQEWNCGAEKKSLNSIFATPRTGEWGYRIAFAATFDDWILALVNETQVSSIPVSFVWGLPTKNERSAYIVCLNLKSGSWRTLELPKGLFLNTNIVRLRRHAAGVVRVGISSLPLLADWNIEGNDVSFASLASVETDASVTDFFGCPSSKQVMFSEGWKCIDGAKWEDSAVPENKTFFQFDSSSQCFVVFQLRLEDEFEFRVFDVNQDYKEIASHSKQSTETIFGTRLVQFALPHFFETRSKTIPAVLRFDSGGAKCVILQDLENTITELQNAGNSFDEVENIVCSVSGGDIAIEGQIRGKAGVILLKASNENSKTVLIVTGGFSLESAATSDLFAISDDGKRLFFREDECIGVIDTKTADRVRRIRFVGD